MQVSRVLRRAVARLGELVQAEAVVSRPCSS